MFRHMTRIKPPCLNINDYNGGPVAFGGSKGQVTGKGKIITRKLDFEDVYFVKELKQFNLFSVSQMCDKKNKVLFTDSECLVLSPDFKLPDENQVLLRVPRQNNMYSFNLENIVPMEGLACLIAKATVDESNKWHRRLGHGSRGNTVMPELSSNGGVCEETSPHSGCLLLQKIKLTKLHVQKEANHSAGTQDNIDAGNSEMEADPTQDYFVLPICCSYILTVKSSEAKNEGLKDKKEANDAAEALRKEFAQEAEDLLLQAGAARATNDSQIPAFEDIYDNPNDGIFTNASYDDEGAVADLTNLETTVNVSPVPTSRIHSIHHTTQILGDPKSAVQTRSKVNKSSGAYAFEELLQFKIQKVWILVDLPYGKKAIGTKWVYMNKKDKRRVMVRNKAKLVAQGYRQEERIDYDEMDVKSAFTYGTIDEEVYVSQPPGFVDPKLPKKMSSMGELTFFLGLQVNQKEDGIFISQDKYVAEILKKFDFMSVKTACTPIETHKPLVKDEEATDVDVQVTPKTSHLHAVKRIFMYLKGKPKLGLWYPRESSFDLVAYSDSDYEAEYVAAANCYGQVLWIQNQMLDYGFNFMNTRIYIDNESIICIVKNLVFHSKTKHIKIRHHFIRDAYEKKLIQVLKIHTDDNVVDLLTKAFNMLNLRRGNCWKLGCSLSVGFYHHTTNGHQFTMSNKHQELASPEQTASALAIPGQTTTGKESSNPLMADSLPKTIQSNDLPLLRGYTLGSREDSLKLMELMEFVQNSTASTNVNGEVELTTSIDGQAKTITEASLRRHLKLEDTGGVTSLPNIEIFKQLSLMGYATDYDKLTFQKVSLDLSRLATTLNRLERSIQTGIYIQIHHSLLVQRFLFKPSGEEEKKDAKDPGNEDSEVPSIKEARVNQENDASVNNTNTINIVSPTINTAGIEDNAIDENIVYGCDDDLNMPELEEIFYSDNDEDVGAEADINNLDTYILVSPIPTTKIHKDHPVEQIIGDIYLAPQTKRMTKSVTEQAMFSSVQQRTNHKDFQNCLFACFLSQEEPKKVWTLVDLPNCKRAIGTKWVYRNKKDERGIVIKNKARFIEQGYTQEEGINYDEVFAPVARIKEIRLFLAYASFKDFVVYQMDVKSAFMYGKIEEEVYVCQPPGFEDPNFPDRVYKVKKALYGLHQALRACDVKTASTPIETHKPLLKDADGEDVDEHLYRSMIGSLMYLTSSRHDIIFAVCACARFQVNPKSSHLCAVKRIFRYLKGQPKLGLWYPKDLPFDLVAYTDSDYAGASLDRKSITGGCQFLGCRLIMAMEEADCEPVADEAPNDENVTTHSNDPLLSGEDRLKLDELMELCTNLLKRLKKVGRTARIESSEDEGLGDQEDASKQGRKIAEKEVDMDEKDVSTADPVTTTGEVVSTANVVVSTTEVTTDTTITTVDELTLAQALIKIKAAKPKVVITATITTTTVVTIPKDRGVVVQEPSKFTITTSPSQLP
ncbi:putative ribonuclease H-like domain-containing protein [Tanacetum coccineum]